MQPYFLPYLGYFSLIKHTDRFILLDAVQYKRHGWIDRNRVLKQQEGWQYVSVPLIKDAGSRRPIQEMKVNHAQPWQRKILSQIEHYKAISPYYANVRAVLSEAFALGGTTISDVNQAALESVCRYLGLECNFLVFSRMDLSIEQPREPDDWALNICRSIGGVDEYWNPPGGATFFSRAKYDEAGIKLQFLTSDLPQYDQKRAFEPGLSIIDVLMFNSVDETRRMLDSYALS